MKTYTVYFKLPLRLEKFDFDNNKYRQLKGRKNIYQAAAQFCLSILQLIDFSLHIRFLCPKKDEFFTNTQEGSFIK